MQENKENLPDISALCGHKTDKEYMKKLNKMYKNCIINKKSNIYFINDRWEMRRYLPNNKRIIAYGNSIEECKEKIDKLYSKYMNENKKEQQMKQNQEIELDEENEM